jgi:hypothetical protein
VCMYVRGGTGSLEVVRLVYKYYMMLTVSILNASHACDV